ncbi:MAG TPA: hypothetical protein P5136_01070 [Methanofastidiosum sp.]|nr:hypothetical protein [Methanofastidiosum sp.]
MKDEHISLEFLSNSLILQKFVSDFLKEFDGILNICFIGHFANKEITYDIVLRTPDPDARFSQYESFFKSYGKPGIILKTKAAKENLDVQALIFKYQLLSIDAYKDPIFGAEVIPVILNRLDYEGFVRGAFKSENIAVQDEAVYFIKNESNKK